MDFEELKVQGVQVYYYFVCPRKLWLYSKQITLEQNSDLVLQGQILHEQSYQSKRKEVSIDDLIKLDIMEDSYVGEVKSSSKLRNADHMQLLYYLYYLKQLGINKKGKVHYVKEKRVDEVVLTEKEEQQIETSLVKIKELLSHETPPKKIKKPYCKKCAYYSFCFVGEMED